PIEMADAMEGRARVRRKITNREDTGDRLSDQLEQAATMLRQQQAEIEALKAHPAELTDEEINEIAKIHYWTMNEECKFDAISFARAILRKAQER
ncbi:hypothetical protein UFOVP11_1, partial [uncultured Caudovirales phage]